MVFFFFNKEEHRSNLSIFLVTRSSGMIELVESFSLDFQIHQLNLYFLSDCLSGTFSCHSGFFQLFEQVAEIDGLPEIEGYFFSGLEYVWGLIREDLFHADVPYRNDYRCDWGVVYHPADSPFEPNELFGHVHPSFREDVDPFAFTELLDAKIDGFLKHKGRTLTWNQSLQRNCE